MENTAGARQFTTVKAYKVIDTITGATLGVWHSVSERGAKTQAAKSRNTEYRYLAAVPFTEEEESPLTDWEEAVFYGEESAPEEFTPRPVLPIKVHEFDTADMEASGDTAWIEVQYGDETDHWTKTFAFTTDPNIPALQEIARSMITAGQAIWDNITVVVAKKWFPEYETEEAPTILISEGETFAFQLAEETPEITAEDLDTYVSESAYRIIDRTDSIPVQNVSRETLPAATLSWYLRPGYPVSIHGREYYTASGIEQKITSLEVANQFNGLSDGRVTEINALKAALQERL